MPLKSRSPSPTWLSDSPYLPHSEHIETSTNTTTDNITEIEPSATSARHRSRSRSRSPHPSDSTHPERQTSHRSNSNHMYRSRSRSPSPSHNLAETSASHSNGNPVDSENGTGHQNNHNSKPEEANVDLAKIYIAGVSFDVTNDELHEVCQPFAKSRIDVRIVFDHVTRRSRGFAFVNCDSTDDAAAILKGIYDHDLKGRKLHPSYATRPAGGREWRSDGRPYGGKAGDPGRRRSRSRERPPAPRERAEDFGDRRRPQDRPFRDNRDRFPSRPDRFSRDDRFGDAGGRYDRPPDRGFPRADRPPERGPPRFDRSFPLPERDRSPQRDRFVDRGPPPPRNEFQDRPQRDARPRRF